MPTEFVRVMKLGEFVYMLIIIHTGFRCARNISSCIGSH
jgi:hypothetical protein